MAENQIDKLREALGERYQIHDVIGRGGMAQVYDATDRRHGRPVAIKVFDPAVGSRLGSRRFLREVSAVAGLAHPNILPLYDSGEVDGLLYYTMPRASDETLAQRIDRMGPLPVGEVLQIGRELADALAYAHGRGMVHRDVKPSNVLMLEHSHVCLGDFGIVWEFDDEEARLTGSGTTVGSPIYMSPEQIESAPSIDGRSDVYSLACVLFEMLTGRPPYEGRTVQAILWRHLSEPVPSAAAIRANIPDDLDELVGQALAKSPSDRPDAAAMLLRLQELSVGGEAAGRPRRIQGGAHQSPAPEKSLVVLPFADLSPEADQAYFSHGLAEEISAGLSRIRDLRVISRTSAQAVRTEGKGVQAIGRELGVRYILEGSVRRAESRLRIVLRLVDSADGTQLWTQQYAGSIADIFEFQERMALDVVAALQIRLDSEEHEMLQERPIASVPAYECYLKARHSMLSWTEEPLNRAMETLERGMEIIGQNPLLMAGKGLTHLQFVNAGIGDPELHLAEATRCAEHIVRATPDSAHGHSLNGMLAALRNDLKPAVESFRRALEADPNDTNALATICLLYGAVGRTAAAIPLVERLLLLDPLTPLNYWIQGWVFWTSGRPDLAVDPIRRMRHLEPGDPAHTLVYANVLAHEGESEQAIEVLEELLAGAPPSPLRSSAEFMVHCLNGSLDLAEASLSGAFADYVRGAWFDSWVVASFFSQLGAKEQALAWLRNAVDCGFINLPFLSVYDPFLSSLRGEPEFRRLMAEVKVKWQDFEGDGDTRRASIPAVPPATAARPYV